MNVCMKILAVKDKDIIYEKSWKTAIKWRKQEACDPRFDKDKSSLKTHFYYMYILPHYHEHLKKDNVYSTLLTANVGVVLVKETTLTIQ